MAVVVAGVHIEAIGTTRQETIDKLDTLADQFLRVVGGVPWQTVIDNVQKVPAETSIKDDEGMCYTGVRRVVFRGPAVREYQGMTFHDGYNVQHGVADGPGD